MTENPLIQTHITEDRTEPGLYWISATAPGVSLNRFARSWDDAERTAANLRRLAGYYMNWNGTEK